MRNTDLKFIVTKCQESGDVEVVLNQFMTEENLTQTETITTISL